MLAVATVSYSLPETAVKVSVLQAFGIHAFATPLHAAANFNYLTVAFGGIEILVPAVQLDAAIEILGHASPGKEESAAQAFMRRPIRNGLAILIQWMLGVPPLPVWARWTDPSRDDGAEAGAGRM